MTETMAAANTEAGDLTPKEIELLTDIDHSEYQDGDEAEDIIDHNIWLDYVVDSKSRGGVLTSLVKKGFVRIYMVPMHRSSNRPAGITDSTIAITNAGWDALNGR